MASHSTVIPEALEELLLQRAGEINPASGRRWQLRELAQWLLSQHGVECSHMAVQRCLTKLRRERSDALKEVLREELLTTLIADWARLDGLANDVYQRADLHSADKSPAKFLACVAELRKIAQTKLNAVARVDAEEEQVKVSGSPKGLAEFLSAAFGPGASPAPSGPVET